MIITFLPLLFQPKFGNITPNQPPKILKNSLIKFRRLFEYFDDMNPHNNNLSTYAFPTESCKYSSQSTTQILKNSLIKFSRLFEYFDDMNPHNNNLSTPAFPTEIWKYNSQSTGLFDLIDKMWHPKSMLENTFFHHTFWLLILYRFVKDLQRF